MTNPDLTAIITAGLVALRFDGLCNEEAGCFCGGDELVECRAPMPTCRAARVCVCPENETCAGWDLHCRPFPDGSCYTPTGDPWEREERPCANVTFSIASS